jgi:hypothetical protein
LLSVLVAISATILVPLLPLAAAVTAPVPEALTTCDG